MDKFEPVAHDETLVRRVMEKPGVKEAYDALDDEYALLRELLRGSSGMPPGGSFGTALICA